GCDPFCLPTETHGAENATAPRRNPTPPGPGYLPAGASDNLGQAPHHRGRARGRSERRGSGSTHGLGTSPAAPAMNDVTRILSAIEQGDPRESEELLPLVYRELRLLAQQRLAQERPGQTLQATALVHEAYLRLVEGEEARRWNSRGHFF